MPRCRPVKKSAARTNESTVRPPEWSYRGRGPGRAEPLSRRRGGPLRLEHLSNPGHDPVAVRENVVFEDRAVRYRHLQGADPLHRRFEPREGRRILGGDRGDFRREAGRWASLVGDDKTAGLLHRVAYRLLIERYEGARIDDFDRNPL